ncbi:MAG TPA: class I SAM-dependent methyltransferase [Opitutaceae bacterium]|nr:class I SAM-dependent methyltransferase [Opitutaceae bacterium]
MLRNVQLTGILGKPRLDFKNNEELGKYYEGKYREGGYEGGFILCGINVSELNHRARHASAFRLLAPQGIQRILDAGCGDGRLSAQIAPHCRDVHAIDIAPNAFDPRHAAGLANLKFQAMNVEHLAFEDEFFDQIVCVETLEHLLNPQLALREFERTLKPGGRLVITYPTINRTFIKKIQERLRIGRRLEISEHLNEWSYDEIVENGKAAGLNLLKSEGVIFDFGVFGWLKAASRFFARGITALSFKITCFPRNSSVVSVVFRKSGQGVRPPESAAA